MFRASGESVIWNRDKPKIRSDLLIVSLDPNRRPTISSTPAGTTMGLKDSEWGQMGVTMMAGTLGWIMDAPAAAAYAVLPVGVDTIRPAERGERQLSGFSCVGGRSPLTVALHGRDEASVKVQIHVGQVRGRPSVHHHLVQHLQTPEERQR